MKKIFTLFCIILLTKSLFSQAPPLPYGPLPTPAQLAWQELEMYCLIHFGVDTYTDKEWGYGDEDPAIVNPVRFNAEQIVGAAKAGGFKGIIVVAKHHDGLCLWPTKTTKHNIGKSPWRGGKGDMIAEYKKACDKMGMKLGLYCSPWDRNSPVYGQHAYVSIYREQLKELYSGYGPLFISWHDGANGGDGYYGGDNGQRKIDRTAYYGWDTTWAITREMQPGAVIFGDVGPDIRWVGNEEGHAGETSWATYTPEAPDKGRAPANGYVKYWEATEGHREGKYWMPAECDVPLRPGWFYHSSQDGKEKSAYTLLDLYYKSVGRGACLDLGIAPGKDGVLSDGDVASLKGFGSLLRQTFAVNLAAGARLSADNIRGSNSTRYGPSKLLDKDRYSYWATDDGITQVALNIDLPSPKTFDVIRLRENIRLGQRIDSLVIDVREGTAWRQLAIATSIGANRLICLSHAVTAKQLRVRIIKAAACIALSDLGLYKEPARVAEPLIGRDKKGLVSITTGGFATHYTTDGTIPSAGSPLYRQPFMLADGGTIKAKSFDSKGIGGEVVTRQWGYAKSGWKVNSPEAANAAVMIDEDERSSFYNDTNAVTAVVVDMGATRTIHAFTYLPRQDKKTAGIADKYEWEVSGNGKEWTKVAGGEFSNIKSNPAEQVVKLEAPVDARYFRFWAKRLISGNSLSAAELGVQ